VKVAVAGERPPPRGESRPRDTTDFRRSPSLARPQSHLGQSTFPKTEAVRSELPRTRLVESCLFAVVLSSIFGPATSKRVVRTNHDRYGATIVDGFRSYQPYVDV
jgi:hypothetical protein